MEQWQPNFVSVPLRWFQELEAQNLDPQSFLQAVWSIYDLYKRQWSGALVEVAEQPESPQPQPQPDVTPPAATGPSQEDAEWVVALHKAMYPNKLVPSHAFAKQVLELAEGDRTLIEDLFTVFKHDKQPTTSPLARAKAFLREANGDFRSIRENAEMLRKRPQKADSVYEQAMEEGKLAAKKLPPPAPNKAGIARLRELNARREETSGTAT